MNGYKIHFDLLRITACFFVIVNHTNSRLFIGNAPSPVWFISVIMFYISKTAVPLFIMISGSLLLSRDQSYKKTFRRIIRIIIVLFLFSVFYYIISIKDFNSVTETDIKNFFLTLYNGAITNAFWYLYLYIGLLIMLPLLQKMICNFNNNDFVYFICGTTFITFVIPVITDFYKLPNYNNTVITPLFNGYLAYFIIGYYIEIIYKRKSKSRFITAVILFIASITFSVIMTYSEFKKNTAAYPYWDNRVSFNIMLPSLCLFYMAKYLSDLNLNIQTISAIKIFSSCTFGIYLLSDMLIQVFEPVYVTIYPYIRRLPAVITLIFVVFFTGFIMIYYLRKLPYMKYLI